MVSIRLQLGTGDRGKRSLAAVRTFRRCAECQSQTLSLLFTSYIVYLEVARL